MAQAPGDAGISAAAPLVVDAAPDHREAWLRNQASLREMPGTEVPWGEGGEVVLLPFEYDPEPVERWRYEACVAAGACPARVIAQPAGDSDDPAAGMSWKQAAVYCRTRDLEIQSGPQDYLIAEKSRRRLIEGADPNEIVVYGFRCVRTGSVGGE